MRDRYWQCDQTCTADCGACKGSGPPAAPDRPGDRDQQQAAEVFDHRMVSGSMAGVDCRCGWHGRGADHPAHVDAEHRAALAAARAEEAARWQAKIEAVLSDRDVVPRDVAIDLRALLDGEQR
jgi:hypothetical protein